MAAGRRRGRHRVPVAGAGDGDQLERDAPHRRQPAALHRLHVRRDGRQHRGQVGAEQAVLPRRHADGE